MKTALTNIILLGAFQAGMLHAENLTTLDGKVYTNFVFVTNYPTVILIKHSGGTSGIKFANLPEDFRKKYNVKEKANAVPLKINSQPTNSDSFLWQNRESDLEQHESDYSTTNEQPSGFTIDKQRWIYLRHGEIELIAFTTTWFHQPNSKELRDTQEMHFDLEQEEIVTNIFNKFFEWDAVATKNHAEKLEKEIARRPMNRSTSSLTKEVYGGVCVYKFIWEDGKSVLSVSDEAPYSGRFDKDDLIHFQTLLTNLPSMKEKLSSAIRNKRAQKDLFK